MSDHAAEWVEDGAIRTAVNARAIELIHMCLAGICLGPPYIPCYTSIAPYVVPFVGCDAPAGHGDGFARTFMSPTEKAITLSIPPRFSERKRAPAAANDDTSVSRIGKQAPLLQRLPGMSDHQLVAYQMSAQRISTDPQHPKNADALRAVPQINAEIRRRTASLNNRSPDNETG